MKYSSQQQLKYLEKTGLPPVNKVTKPKKYKLVWLPTGEIMLDNSDWILCDTKRKEKIRMGDRYKKEQFKIEKV